LTLIRPSPVAASKLPPARFWAPRKIRFSDCDPAGIAYTARLIDQMNGVIEDFFPVALGLDYQGMIAESRIGLGYASVHCDFFRPAQMGARLEVSVLIERIGERSATFLLHAHDGEDEIFRASFVMSTTSLSEHRSIPLPPTLREALTAYRNQQDDR
jgi:4-hydroxybenzoyl-CoA thioesterase